MVKFSWTKAVCFHCAKLKCDIIRNLASDFDKKYRGLRIDATFKILRCNKLLTRRMVLDKKMEAKEKERTRQKIARLSPTTLQAEAVRLREDEGLTFRKIAVRMGITYQMAHFHYKAAIKKRYLLNNF